MAKLDKIKKFFIRYQSEFVKLWLLAIAFFSALLVAPIFKVPYANPYNISNPYSPQGVNPSNNFIVLIAVIVLTVSFFFLLQKIYLSKYRYVTKIAVALLWIGYYFLSDMLTMHAGNSLGPGDLNVFHVGEQLSPAAAYLSGMRLYSDIIFLRGAGIDVLFPGLGLALFGKTIGAFILMNDIYRVGTLLVFSLLLGKTIKNPIVYSFALTLFFIAEGTSIFELRDVFIWAVFGLLLYAFRPQNTAGRSRFALFGIGFLSSLLLYVTVDRGVLLFVVCILFSAFLLFVGRRDNGTYSITKSCVRNGGMALPSGLGLLVGLIVPIAFIGIDGFAAFLRLTFHDIPNYAGLLVSMPFPELFGPAYQIWGPVFIAIAAILMYVQLLRGPKARSRLDTLIPLGFMLLFSVLCLKMGTNRIDINKMATVTAPLFFSVVVLLAVAAKTISFDRKIQPDLTLLAIMVLICVTIFARFNIGRFAVTPNYSRAQLKAYAKTPRLDDSYWLSWEMNETAKVIRNNTQTGDYIYAFTSDPMYYYLAGRKNPGRMYINWYNDPQPYTDELMEDLKTKQPKVIIYSEQTWMDSPDNVPMAERIPEVNEWIIANYPVETTIGKTTLRSKTVLN